MHRIFGLNLDGFGLSMSNSLLINLWAVFIRKTATTHSATNEAGDTEPNQPQLEPSSPTSAEP